jgi:hypothetical protein
MPDDEVPGGPHLSAAFLCEKILQEKTDGAPSFIRVVDRFTRPNPTPGLPPQSRLIQVMMVVAFKAGGVSTGKYKIKLRIRKPNEAQIGEIEKEAFFEGGKGQGVTIAHLLNFIPDEEGLYWIDVLFEDRLVTRIPFRVIFAAVQMIKMQGPSQQPGR